MNFVTRVSTGVSTGQTFCVSFPTIKFKEKFCFNYQMRIVGNDIVNYRKETNLEKVIFDHVQRKREKKKINRLRNIRTVTIHRIDDLSFAYTDHISAGVLVMM